jgi:hypothetical protein
VNEPEARASQFTARLMLITDLAYLLCSADMKLMPRDTAQHFKPDFLMKELGVPVVEGIGAPIRLAHMLVHLKLNYSRTYWPRSPLYDGK